jgi:hypothetical protein
MSGLVRKLKEKINFQKNKSSMNDGNSSSSSSSEDEGRVGSSKPTKIHHWRPDKQYSVGDKVSYNKKTYDCIMSHMSSQSTLPNVSPLYWKESGAIKSLINTDV